MTEQVERFLRLADATEREAKLAISEEERQTLMRIAESWRKLAKTRQAIIDRENKARG